MAGNSRRRGAVRKAGTKKGPTVGSGGVRRRGLEGRGATPPAHMRPNHPAAKRAAKAARSSSGRPQARPTTPRSCSAATRCWSACAPGCPPPRCTSRSAPRPTSGSPNPSDCAADSGISILEVPRHDLDRIARQRPASGHRAAGAAVRLRASRRPAGRRDEGQRARAAGGAGQHLRSTQPRRDRPLGGGVRRPRRGDPAAAVGVGHRGGLAHQRGCGRPGAGGAGRRISIGR